MTVTGQFVSDQSAGNPGALRSEDTATPRTDPKFARESFTMRRMRSWQIAALVIAAAVAIGLFLVYM